MITNDYSVSGWFKQQHMRASRGLNYYILDNKMKKPRLFAFIFFWYPFFIGSNLQKC